RLDRQPCPSDAARRISSAFPVRGMSYDGPLGAPCARCGARSPQDGASEQAPQGHSALMLAARNTLAHFSVSATMSLPKSAGEPASTEPPRSAMRAFILASASAALISLLSLSMMSAGVPLGVPIPYH